MATCTGNPSDNPKAASANACSSSHCGADNTSGTVGISISKFLQVHLPPFLSLPIARHGPKFNTGGIPKASHTSLKLSPASFAAPGDISPTFSSPPEEHPADKN